VINADWLRVNNFWHNLATVVYHWNRGSET
jgi:hypothetical protein